MEGEVLEPFELGGRLVVPDLSRVPIRSKEGRRYITERHAAVMENVSNYEGLTRHLFKPSWAKRFLDASRKEAGTLADWTHPSFYLEAKDLTTGIYHPQLLERASAGIEFLAAKAPSRNRKDLIGNLLKGVSVSAEFEVLIAWALVAEIGPDAVVPYPCIDESTKENVDFAVDLSGERVLLEATVLQDDQESRDLKLIALSAGQASTMHGRTEDQDIHRLAAAALSKIQQRNVNAPIVLCLNQVAAFPDPAAGVEAVGKALAREVWDTDSNLIGIGYFTCSSVCATMFAERRISELVKDRTLVGRLRSALCLLDSAQNYVHDSAR